MAVADFADPPNRPLVYDRSRGVDDFVARVWAADPMQLIATERRGVACEFVKDLSTRMGVPVRRMFAMLGEPKAMANERLTGTAGQAALGLARLLGVAFEIVANSTAADAHGFDAARWLGKWLEQAQPALGGRRSSELIDTPTGLVVAAKLLGAIESGAYQ